tara:strand:+ start:4412 stop:4549 length:138 start_codon:yes stop_codon:yes gene_type:complete
MAGGNPKKRAAPKTKSPENKAVTKVVKKKPVASKPIKKARRKPTY